MFGSSVRYWSLYPKLNFQCNIISNFCEKQNAKMSLSTSYFDLIDFLGKFACFFKICKN